ncbi:hypothetical protein D3C87_76680 [compost metagenome]
MVCFDIDDFGSDMICTNECYQLTMGLKNEVIGIYFLLDEEFDLHPYYSYKDEELEIQKRIVYWKENERYLMRLLESK